MVSLSVRRRSGSGQYLLVLCLVLWIPAVAGMTEVRETTLTPLYWRMPVSPCVVHSSMDPSRRWDDGGALG